MDLHKIQHYLRPNTLAEVPPWRSDWAWLAGGTWLFSEPQPQITTLVDLQHLGGVDLEISPKGLAIGAGCVMSRLLSTSYPAAWTGVMALQRAVQELASFKVQNRATIAGNLCLAIPAGTFAPVMLLLNAQYEILPADAAPAYTIPAAQFQTGVRQTRLQPGDLLHRIGIAAENLQDWRIAYHRFCTASAGLALAIAVVAHHPPSGRVRASIGASVPAPRLLLCDRVAPLPTLLADLRQTLATLPFLNDDLASADYRHHLTQVLIERSLHEVLTG